jgi:hypothetical protein
VEISAPGGEEIAKRTFNAQLGILGGISILGTSGIVEPMSEQALIDTIKVKMDVRKADGAEYLVITPGNYGETFLKSHIVLSDIDSVKCSNFNRRRAGITRVNQFQRRAAGRPHRKVYQSRARSHETRIPDTATPGWNILRATRRLGAPRRKSSKGFVTCGTTEDASRS